MANALTACRNGANWISSSINGIGERCGITDTIALMANLHELDLRNKVDGELLQYVSLLVQSHTRNPVDRLRPVTGENATVHVAKLHQRAIRANPSAYSWVNPEEIGKRIELDPKSLPSSLQALINVPNVVGASELKFHTNGVGDRYLMIDDRVVPDCRQYCIVRDIPITAETPSAHVDMHRHICDSLFIFLGHLKGLKGLKVEVSLGSEVFIVDSPCSVFIPSGILHSYRIISGPGLFINHVLNGNYNSSLLEKFEKSLDNKSLIIDAFLKEHYSNINVSETDELSDVLDSLAFLDFFVYLETHFGEKISLDEVIACHTFGDLYAYISKL
jgi:2-isopropylmalate synthase